MKVLLDSTKTDGNIGEDYWLGVRDQFLLDPAFIHLSLSVIAPHPKRVREAIKYHREHFDVNPAKHYKKKDEMQRSVLNSAARYLSTFPSLIALVESTTMGLAIVLGGMQLFPGEEILTTEHEHYACREMLRYKARDSKCILKKIELFEEPCSTTADEIVRNLKNHITSATRLLVLTWVHSCSGVKLPLKEIALEIEKINASRPDPDKVLVCLDALHGFGIEDLKVEGIGCDFFIAGCHKSLFGPRGTGIVWGNKRGWERINPIIPSFDIEVFWPWYEGFIPSYVSPKARLCSPGGFGAFEHKWALNEAFEFHLAIGKKRIQERVHALKSYAQNKMSKLKHIHIRTPNSESLSSGMVCFDVDGLDPSEVVDFLEKKNIMIGQTPYRDSCARFSLSILNTKADIDRGINALKAIREQI